MAVMSVISVATLATEPPGATNIWSLMEGWGNAWVWENLTIRGEASWLAEAIKDSSLVAATDGSYMKDTYPDVTAAAFIFECSRGRGSLWGSFKEKVARCLQL